jgi:hypothetical protein
VLLQSGKVAMKQMRDILKELLIQYGLMAPESSEAFDFWWIFVFSAVLIATVALLVFILLFLLSRIGTQRH